MEDKKNNNQQTVQSGEQNPTLQQPGSQVADYGNPTGGSANKAEQDKSGQQQDSGRGMEGNDQTIGNP